MGPPLSSLAPRCHRCEQPVAPGVMICARCEVETAARESNVMAALVLVALVVGLWLVASIRQR